MTVLFIVMEFVPLNLGGVFRPLRFVNGMKKAGIDPIIVTFEVDERLLKLQNRYDEKLLDKLDKNIMVYRVPLGDITQFYSNKFKRFINIYFNATDNYLKAWEVNLYNQLPAIIEKHKPIAVMVTCPPFSAAVLGEKISKKYNLPYILDMRDAWAKLSMVPLGSIFHYWRKLKIERSAFSRANAIITVTPQLKKIFESSHKKLNNRKFSLIYNSFDFELQSNAEVSFQSIQNKEVINIGYVGSFYYSPEARDMMMKRWWQRKGHRMLQYTPIKEDWQYRSPYFFFKALSLLFIKQPEWKNKIFFHHIGETPEWLAEMAEEMDLKENIIVHGFKPLEDVLSLQQAFDALLATSEKVIDKEHYCLPSKLFTYLRSGKPLIAFVTNGIQREFILNSNLGIICDPDDLNGAVKELELFFINGYQSSLNSEYLNSFNSETASSQVVSLVRRVIGES